MGEGKGGTSFLKIFFGSVFGTIAGGCLLLVVGGVVLLAILGGVAKKAKEKAAAEQARMDALPISAVTWDDVVAVYGPGAETTGLQKQERWKDFAGRKVQWTGTLIGAHKFWGQLHLQLRLDEDLAGKLRQIVQSDVYLQVRASEEQLAQARALAPGSTVTFVGVLDRHHARLGKRFAMVALKGGGIVSATPPAE